MKQNNKTYGKEKISLTLRNFKTLQQSQSKSKKTMNKERGAQPTKVGQRKLLRNKNLFRFRWSD